MLTTHYGFSITPNPLLKRSTPQLCIQNTAPCDAVELRFGETTGTISLKPDFDIITLRKKLDSYPNITSKLVPFKRDQPETPFSKKLVRLKLLYEFLDKLSGEQNLTAPQNAFEAYCRLMTALVCIEDKIFGEDNSSHDDRMYEAAPRALWSVKGNSELLVCRNRKNLIFFFPDGEFQIWGREPIQATTDPPSYHLVGKSDGEGKTDGILWPFYTGLGCNQTPQRRGFMQNDKITLDSDNPSSFHTEFSQYLKDSELTVINGAGISGVYYMKEGPTSLPDDFYTKLKKLYQGATKASNVLEAYSVIAETFYQLSDTEYDDETEHNINIMNTLPGCCFHSSDANDKNYYIAHPNLPLAFIIHPDGSFEAYQRKKEIGPERVEPYEINMAYFDLLIKKPAAKKS